MAFRFASDVKPSAGFRRTAFYEHARAEDRKLRKELALEVLALKVPFGNLPIVPEFSPVAGTIYRGLTPSTI